MAEQTQPEPVFEPIPEPEVEPPPAPKADWNLPLIITLSSLVIWFGFQAFQQLRERSNLTFMKANQESALQESQKVQTQFQSILTKLSELANKGHAGARLVMEQLQRQGLSVGSESRPQPMPPEIKPTK